VFGRIRLRALFRLLVGENTSYVVDIKSGKVIKIKLNLKQRNYYKKTTIILTILILSSLIKIKLKE
jgi:hypothetical protein